MSNLRPAQMDFGGAFSRPPKATLALMVITAVLSVLAMADVGFGTRGALASSLMFAPAQVFGLKVWTPFSYLFLAPQPLELVFYELMFWFFASPLERSWGQGRFLLYFFTTGIGAALLLTGLSLLLPGLMGAMIPASWVAGEALLMAFILTNWHATIYLFIFPVRAPYMLIFSVALPALYALMGAWQQFLGLLLSMGIGYLLLKRGLSPRRAWLHLRAWWIDRQLKRRSRHLQVVPPPEHDREPKKPKYLN